MSTLPLRRAPERSVGRRLWIGGHVQGVGFRPFLYRLALRQGLGGWVRNTVGEVEVLVHGAAAAVEAFTRSLVAEAPAIASPRIHRQEDCEAPPPSAFRIEASVAAAEPRIFVPPDYFTCPDCLAELADRNDRRYGYPFINCTQCGPRYTLIRSLPYDRPGTTMAGFPLCDLCRREYEDPADRRFHAEPIACPACGPSLNWVGPDGARVTDTTGALRACVAAVQAGRLVAVKGIGGYHLVCDAANTSAVERLRRLKPRPTKPLAVMFPLEGRDGLEAVYRCTEPTAEEAALLLSPVRPIVLVRRRDAVLSPALAPGLAELGAMLPYSPLHALLLTRIGGPVVASSANVSGEPVLTEATDVETRLAHLVDGCLHHDRPIARPADDPVWRRVGGRLRPVRLGRGCAPAELPLPAGLYLERPVLAVGGHMKNTIALAWQDRCVLSPHIGDMGSERSLAVFEQVVADLQRLYGVRAGALACDAHPGYATARWARSQGLPLTEVLHHHAHAAALAAEMPGTAPLLVFTWDGVGYGADGTLWGGEALLGRPGRWQRVASLRPFRLPGGERAAREPWRSAAALCWETSRAWPECPDTDGLARMAWERRLNSPQSSAMGRLFDAAAALTGHGLYSSYEGEGPMRLEAASREPVDGGMPLPLATDADGVLRADWAPLLDLLLDGGVDPAERATQFHDTPARTALAVYLRLCEKHPVGAVGATGGVLQNRRLADRLIELFAEAGVVLGLPQLLPANDGAIAFGQAVEVAALAVPAGTR